MVMREARGGAGRIHHANGDAITTSLMARICACSSLDTKRMQVGPSCHLQLCTDSFGDPLRPRVCRELAGVSAPPEPRRGGSRLEASDICIPPPRQPATSGSGFVSRLPDVAVPALGRCALLRTSASGPACDAPPAPHCPDHPHPHPRCSGARRRALRLPLRNQLRAVPALHACANTVNSRDP